MESRPKPEVKLTQFDKALELIGVFTLLVMWGLAVYYFFILPNIIPIHFNTSGQPDGYGPKYTLFILPVTALIIYILLTQINKRPNIFNYTTKITAANALHQYTNGTKVIRYLKTFIVVLFTVIFLFANLMATGKSRMSGSWLLPLTLALVYVPAGYFVFKSFTTAK